MDGDSDGCVIKTLWAVDVNKAALNSFQLNYQDAQTFQDVRGGAGVACVYLLTVR